MTAPPENRRLSATFFGYRSSKSAEVERQLAELAQLKLDKARLEADNANKEVLLAGKVDKEKLLVDWLADKDKQVAGLEADKVLLVADKQGLEAEKLELKARLLAVESLAKSFRNMRPLLESYVQLLSPGTSTAVGIAALVASFAPGDVLNQVARDVMTSLEGTAGPFITPVTKDLKHLMHRLSAPHHFTNAPLTGFVCGGEMTLRLATALTLVMAQRELVARGFAHNAGLLINYCDECGNVLKRFQNGNVF